MNNLYNASVQHFKAQETAAIATIKKCLKKNMVIFLIVKRFHQKLQVSMC